MIQTFRKTDGERNVVEKLLFFILDRTFLQSFETTSETFFGNAWQLSAQ